MNRPEPRQDAIARSLATAGLAASVAYLLWHSLRYSFVTDDAYISLVYARNLAEHGELTFNLGEPVEGFTNFLWTVLLAGFHWAGIPAERAALLCAPPFAVGSMMVSYRLVGAMIGRPTPWQALPPALLALSAGYACWTSGGLETQMFTFFVIAGVSAYIRADGDVSLYGPMGVWIGLAAMTRPEGVLVGGILAAHRVVVVVVRDRRLVPLADEWRGLLWFLAVWGPFFAWRWWYYGYPFPNTYYVKAAGDAPPGYDATMIENGLYYVSVWARQSGALWAAPVAALALIARPRTARFVGATVLFLIIGVYLAYAVKVGGDFMGLHRFVMPLTVAVSVAFTVGLWRGFEFFGARGRYPALVLCGAIVFVHGVTQHQLTNEMTRWGNWASDRGIDTPAFLKVYSEDRAVIGDHMKECFEEGDFSIVGGAGAKPYHGRVRGVDVFGLVSAQIAHEVPRNRARAGHNKWAPDAMLLKMEPEFVFSCYSIHADPKRPRMNCSGSFWRKNGYERITLHIPGLKQQGEYYTFWKRKDRVFECPGIVK